MFRDHADIIGMTLVPECQLARELEMCYVSLAMITDYDVWAEKPVDIKVVMETMEENIENIKALLNAAIPKIGKERKCSCKEALKNAEV
jgi:5'-methylthioadenosine phosphorylase